MQTIPPPLGAYPPGPQFFLGRQPIVGLGGRRELAEQAFMVGIVSLMPALIERSGVHGQLLQIVEENDKNAKVEQAKE